MNPARMTYLDFELEIGSVRGREYLVAVVRSPAGEVHEPMHFPYDELALESRLLVLGNALLDSSGRTRQFLSPEALAVRNFGRDLFDALFTGEVRRCYELSLERAWQEDKGIRLRLRIQPPELAALPWEFLYDPRQAEYVCLSRSTSVVRYLEPPRPLPPLPVNPPLRILGMIAKPEDLEALEARREKEQVARALQGLQSRGLAELVWLEGQSWRHLQGAMQRGPWHVFHFIGHGGFSRAGDEGFVTLADEGGETRHLSATQLGRLLADHRSLRLALLNAPKGVRGRLRDSFSRTAAALVERGIPAVLAIPYEMTDAAVVELARAFYEAIAEGVPVDVAMAEARKAVSLALANSVEWGAPALYMGTPDGLLFTIQSPVVQELREVPVPSPTPPPAPPRSGEGRPTPPSLPAKPAPATPRGPGRGRLEGLILAPSPQSPAPGSQPSAPSPQEGQPIEPEFVLIPAGEFLIGSDPEKDPRAYAAEQPRHSLYLPDYSIGRTPVTNAQYAAFVEATGYKAPNYWEGGKPPVGKEDHPVVYVSWHDARAYCEWLSEKKGQACRLPSEAEWEKAARGTEGWIYPWGDAWHDGCCNSHESGSSDATPVGRYSPQGDSPYGCADMAGNVWEWTGSLYKDYPYDPQDGRENPRAAGPRVLRGGAFYSSARRVRCAYRDTAYPDDWRGAFGFRVALAPG